MKILHLSSLDAQTGAGIAAARIHSGLLGRGVESRFCVIHPTAGLQNSFTPKVTLPGRFARVIRTKISNHIVHRYAPDYDYVLSTGLVGFDIREIVEREKPDVLQLHWIAGHAFRLATLARVRVPVVWRLSDMWPFCGLEHLEPEASRYASPLFGYSASERARRRKRSVYRRISDLTLVSPSRWLAREVKRSALLGARPVELIPTSCDTFEFELIDRTACREVLGLRKDAFIPLVGASSMATRVKGLDLFVKALSDAARGNLANADIQVVTFGKDPLVGPQWDAAVAVKHFGQIRDRLLMSILYNAADVYVAPSRMENLSNAVLESLASGTPVVAFDIGGMPDMIDHRANGFLARPFDTSSLAEGIHWSFELREDPRLRQAARDKVLAEFSVEREIDAYLRLYRRLARAPQGRARYPAESSA